MTFEDYVSSLPADRRARLETDPAEAVAVRAEYDALLRDAGAGAGDPPDAGGPAVAPDARAAAPQPLLPVQSFDPAIASERFRFAQAMKLSHPSLYNEWQRNRDVGWKKMLAVDAANLERFLREGGLGTKRDGSLADADYFRWAKAQGLEKSPTWGDLAGAAGRGLWSVAKGVGKTAWLLSRAQHDPRAAATLAASIVEGAQGAVSSYKQLGAGAAALLAKFSDDDNVRLAAAYEYARFAAVEDAKQGEWRGKISPAFAKIEVDKDVVGVMEEVLDPANVAGLGVKSLFKGASKVGLEGVARFGAKEIRLPKLPWTAPRMPLVGQVDELSRELQRAHAAVTELEEGVARMRKTLEANPAPGRRADALAEELARAEAALDKERLARDAADGHLTLAREKMEIVAAEAVAARTSATGGTVVGDLRILRELQAQGAATIPLMRRLRQAEGLTHFTRRTAALLDDSGIAWAGDKALTVGGAAFGDAPSSAITSYIGSGGDLEAAAESVGSGAGFGVGGLAWDSVTRSRDSHFTAEELEANRVVFRDVLSKREVAGGSQLQHFVRLDRADQLAIATYAQAHPGVAFTFVDEPGGRSGHYDRERNTVVINKAARTSLREIFRHEIGHFIERHGFTAQIRDLYLGNAETGRVGEYTRLDAEGRPVVEETVDFFGRPARRYALNDAGLALKRQYEQQLRPEDPAFEITDGYFASELFAEQYADRLFSGAFRRDLRRSPLDSLADALAPGPLLKKFMGDIGLGFDRGDQVVGTGLFRGQGRNPHIEALAAELNRASARGERPALDAAPEDQRFTPEALNDREVVARWLHSGRAVKFDAEGRPLYDADGAPQRPTAEEAQAAQRELANALLHELEAHAAAEPDGRALHRSEAPTADGPQAIATARTIPAGAIDALAGQGRFNPHQLAHLRALAATVEQHGSGALVSHFYQTEAPAGYADQSVSGRWQRHGVVGFQITPDGSVGVHAVAWEPLYKAAKTAAAADPARLAYATSGGDLPAAITADARSYLDNAAAGRPAGEGLTAARAEFIKDFLGLPAHLTPEAGGLAALSGSSQPFLATLSLDRMNRVTPLDPVDALSGLQHDLDADSSWGELQFRPGDTPADIARKRELARIKFGAHLRRLIGAPPPDMYDPHAHHILFKEGNGEEQKALVREGHEILRRHGIDPIMGKENLVWAPNRVEGQHSVETLRNVVDALKRVEAESGSYKDIVRELRKLGQAAAQRKRK